MLAIAKYTGDLTNTEQFKKVLIVSCTDQKFENTFFCVDQHVEIGRHYLVQLEPEDQFCRIIPLAEAQKALEFSSSKQPQRTGTPNMNATSQLDDLVAFLNEALPRLLPGETIRVEDGIVYGADDAVTTQETEFPGWSVSTWHYILRRKGGRPQHIMGSRRQYPSWIQAANAFLVEIFRDKVDREKERQSVQ